MFFISQTGSVLWYSNEWKGAFTMKFGLQHGDAIRISFWFISYGAKSDEVQIHFVPCLQMEFPRAYGEVLGCHPSPASINWWISFKFSKHLGPAGKRHRVQSHHGCWWSNPILHKSKFDSFHDCWCDSFCWIFGTFTITLCTIIHLNL